MPDWSAPRSGASALLLTRLGEEHGASAEALLSGTGLTLEGLRVPGAEITGLQELGVLRNLQRLCPDPALPLQAGTRYHLTTYGIWGFALASSPSVRSAIDVGSRFVDLSFTFCDLTIETVGDELRIGLDDTEVPADVRAFVVARDLAGLRTIVSELTQSDVPLTSLTVTLAEPPDVSPWESLFGRVPAFGAASNAAGLDAEFLDTPLPHADELTAALTEQQCRALVEARRARTGVAGRVRDLVLRTPSALPSVDEVAAALHTSARTLRRQLADEGTSYRALVDEVRAALAEELLRALIPVEQVARRLGYAETASFTHAFHRWKGMSPRTWLRTG